MLQEMSKIYEEDVHDDNLIVMDTSDQINNWALMCVAENAVDSHILETDDLEDNANSPLDVHNYNPLYLL